MTPRLIDACTSPAVLPLMPVAKAPARDATAALDALAGKAPDLHVDDLEGVVAVVRRVEPTGDVVLRQRLVVKRLAPAGRARPEELAQPQPELASAAKAEAVELTPTRSPPGSSVSVFRGVFPCFTTLSHGFCTLSHGFRMAFARLG